MNLLIVTANKSEIDKHLPQLKLLGFAVDVVFDVEGAKKVLATKPVAVVMLSWSLEGTNLPAVYKVISEDHGLPCLIFSEDRSRKVTNLLLTSGIRNVIYPPLSPHGIHRRIQLLMRTHQGRGGQGLKKLGTVRPEAGPAESRRDRKRSLQQSVKKSFEKMAQEGKTAAVPDGAKSCAVLAEIQWPESQGYLVMACDRPFRETGFLNKLQALVIQDLEAQGEAQGGQSKTHEVELDFKIVKKWVSVRAECFVTEKLGNADVLIAFADTDSLPAVAPTTSVDFTWVDVNRWLNLKGKLPFDIYVHLPENEKFVLYIRKDSVISEQNLDRLEKIGNDRCFIKPADCVNMFKHLFTNLKAYPSVDHQ